MSSPLLLTTVGIADENDKVLFIQRANEPFHGLYSLPGGKLKESESVAEGAAREIQEELGLSLANLQYLETIELKKPGHAIISVYISRVTSPVTLRPSPREVLAIKWVSGNELSKLGVLPPNHARVAENIFSALKKLCIA